MCDENKCEEMKCRTIEPDYRGMFAIHLREIAKLQEENEGLKAAVIKLAKL